MGRITGLRFFMAISVGLVLVAGVAAKEKKTAASAPAPTYIVGLLPFQDMSGSEHGEQLKQVLAKQLQAELLNCSSLTPKMMKPAGDNPEEAEVDIAYAVKLGKYYKADLVVMGSLLSADVEESEGSMSGPSIGGVSVSGSARSQDATVVLQAEIIDVSRGQKLTSVRATGKHHDSKVSPNISTEYGSMDMGGAYFQSTTLGKATQKAIGDLVAKILQTAQGFSPASGPAAAPPEAGDTSQPASASGAGGSSAPASSACKVLFRVLLSTTMSPLKDYTVAVGGEDRSGEVKDGVLQINNPASQFVLQVTVKNPPEDAQVQPVYAGTVDCRCDKPEKVLVLEIDSKGSGKFNWWQ